jgi:hypothetical protein
VSQSDAIARSSDGSFFVQHRIVDGHHQGHGIDHSHFHTPRSKFRHDDVKGSMVPTSRNGVAAPATSSTSNGTPAVFTAFNMVKGAV